jgi:hypothetical protein
MRDLVRIEDLYKDKTTFYKTLQKGEGAASPFKDSIILSKIQI